MFFYLNVTKLEPTALVVGAIQIAFQTVGTDGFSRRSNTDSLSDR